MEFLSFSKINYTLIAGKKESSGFHSLKSVVQTINLTDRIILNTNNTGKIRLSSVSSIPLDENNTVFRAAKLFKETYGISEGFDIHIEKNIPTEAGLGGGSGNASAVLLALDRLFSVNAGKNALSSLSAKIGSDCPLFVYGGSLYMTGRGDIITPIPPLPKTYLLIVKPSWGVSTKEAYSLLDRRKTIEDKGQNEKIIHLSEKNKLTFECLAELLHNDFEIINSEKINAVKSDMAKAEAHYSLLCGSGSCIFAMFPDPDQRDYSYNRLKNIYKTYKAESV